VTGSGPEWSAAPDPPRIRPFISGPHRPDRPAESDQPAARPRPFILTAGRVRGADPAISLETQVTAVPVPPPGSAPIATLPPELQAIIALCAEPLSVAEISARVPLHLGVTKILVGDLRATGYLDVHTQDVIDPTDPDLILRVIRGLRAIS
jgi:hypothetical protein